MKFNKKFGLIVAPHVEWDSVCSRILSALRVDGPGCFMERIGSAALGIAVIFIGGLMIVVPQFVEFLSGAGPYLFWNGLFFLAFGVIKLVNGIEGIPRIKANSADGASKKPEPRVWRFIPIRSFSGNAASDEKIERDADNNKK